MIIYEKTGIPSKHSRWINISAGERKNTNAAKLNKQMTAAVL